MWEQSQRYPDPSVEVLDSSFNAYRLPLASVERLATGCRWSEGPVWFGDGRYVLWSDIPNDRILKWEEETGAVSVFRKTSWNANGNTRDRQGRLVTCEHRGRRVTRTEYDGSISVLMDRHQGKRLNSPNDVVVKSDGSIWFSDPLFGISGYYEGEKADSELPASVWRIDGQTGEATMMADDVDGPNGLAFSPDEAHPVRRCLTGDPKSFDPCLRRRGLRPETGQKPGIHRRRRRDAGRLPGRCRWQPMVRLGHGRCGAGRCARVRSPRDPDRPYRTA